MVCHQADLLSGWSLIWVVFHQDDDGLWYGLLSHRVSLIMLVFHEGGLSSSGLMRVVSSGGPTSGWPLIGVVS